MAAPGLCREEGLSQPGATGSPSDTLVPWIPVSLVLRERTGLGEPPQALPNF